MATNKMNQGHPYIHHLKEGALRTFLVKQQKNRIKRRATLPENAQDKKFQA
ncbi:MAG: hypothetical protein U1D70_13270 [Methylobacter sp.]|nr:hypothetical protein [Methylobacter sp.]MDZ4219977.1 hypothetical protein [Methylobacter sp.]